MSTAEIRHILHQQIDNSDERLLKMVYAMMKEYAHGNTEESDDARKRIIDAEREKYLSGTGRSYSWAEVRYMAINRQTTNEI